MALSREPLRRLLEKRAGGKSWLRLQTATLLLFSFLCGLLTSHLALKMGATAMHWRFPLVVMVSYGAFLLLIRLWLSFTGVAEQGARLAPDHQEEAREKPSEGQRFGEKAADVADGFSSVADVGSLVDAEGCLPAIGVVIFLAAVGLVLTAIWWFFGGFLGAASAALVDAGVEALLAVGMARMAGGSAGSWVEGAFRASWRYWLALVVIAWLVGLAAGHWAPEAQTLGQALHAVID